MSIKNYCRTEHTRTSITQVLVVSKVPKTKNSCFFSESVQVSEIRSSKIAELLSITIRDRFRAHGVHKFLGLEFLLETLGTYLVHWRSKCWSIGCEKCEKLSSWREHAVSQRPKADFSFSDTTPKTFRAHSTELNPTVMLN